MCCPWGRSGSRVLLGCMRGWPLAGAALSASLVLPHLHSMCDGSALRGRNVGGEEEKS